MILAFCVSRLRSKSRQDLALKSKSGREDTHRQRTSMILLWGTNQRISPGLMRDGRLGAGQYRSRLTHMVIDCVLGRNRINAGNLPERRATQESKTLVG